MAIDICCFCLKQDQNCLSLYFYISDRYREGAQRKTLGTSEESPSKLAIELRALFSCSVPHTKSLESRIKEELIAQGLLESEDRPAEDSEDEVLAELRKRQAELKALSAHNRTKKHDLLR